MLALLESSALLIIKFSLISLSLFLPIFFVLIFCYPLKCRRFSPFALQIACQKRTFYFNCINISLLDNNRQSLEAQIHG
jgi:hypothetical protein